MWPVLAGELGCSATASGDVGAGFEQMATHVEECERCAGLRSGALAVIGPVELLALSQHGLLDGITARLYDTAQRVGDLVTAVPPAGRTAAVAGLAAAALAGGSRDVGRRRRPHDARPAPVAAPVPTPAHLQPAPAAATRDPDAGTQAATQEDPALARRRGQPPPRRPFERRPRPSPLPHRRPVQRTGTGEFGFEQD